MEAKMSDIKEGDYVSRVKYEENFFDYVKRHNYNPDDIRKNRFKVIKVNLRNDELQIMDTLNADKVSFWDIDNFIKYKQKEMNWDSEE